MPRSRIDPGQPLTALGLDSLSAVELQQAAEARLGRRVALGDLMRGITLEQLAANLVREAAGEARAEEAEEETAPAPRLPGEPCPLSYGQRALWSLHTWAPAGAAYNLAAAAATASPIDAAALRRSLAILVARHAALRTRYGEREGEPFQIALAAAALDFGVESAPGLDGEELRERLRAEAFRPFDLAGGTPLRVRLWETAPDRRVLLLAVHHIAADFTSVSLLLRELDRLYLQETGAVARVELPPPAAGYLDYVRWQERQLAGEAGRRSWLYWRERLSGELPLLALSTDRPRSAVLSDPGDALSLRLGAEATGRLREAARSAGVTLFSVLLAAFAILLHRHTGQLDLLVGSPAAGRTRRRFADLVGYCVQTVVLRVDLAGEPAAAELLRRTRDTVAGALEHQDFPLPVLAERLRPGRDAGRSSLFQAMFVLHRGRPSEGLAAGLAEIALGAGGVRLDLGGMELESIALEEHRAQLDLTLATAETGDGLLLALQYSRDLFDAPGIARMLGHLQGPARRSHRGYGPAGERAAAAHPGGAAADPRGEPRPRSAVRRLPARPVRCQGRVGARGRSPDRRRRAPDVRRAQPAGEPAGPPSAATRRPSRRGRRRLSRAHRRSGGRRCSPCSRPGRDICLSIRPIRGSAWPGCSRTRPRRR